MKSALSFIAAITLAALAMAGVPSGLGLRSAALVGTVGGGTGVDADAAAYFTAITSAGSTISSDQQAAVSAFVVAAKAHGYWANLLDCSPLAGANLTAARVKLKVFSGAATSLSNSNFVSGDYSAATGIHGGATKKMGSGVHMDDIGSVGGLSFFIPDKDFVPSGVQQMIGGGFGSPYCNLDFVGTLYAGWGTINPFTTTPDASSPFGMGLYRAFASATNAHSVTVGDALLIGSAGDVATDKADEITLFALPADDWFYTMHCGWYGIDDGQITGQKSTDFMMDMWALQLALGRITPAAAAMNFVPIMGQSLAVGGGGDTALNVATITANNNRMQTMPEEFTQGFRMGNLVQLAAYIAEHPGLQFANTLSSISGSHDNDVTLANWGDSGTPISGITQGTAPYNHMLQSVQRAKDLAPYYNTGFAVRPVMFVHGEADVNSNTYQAEAEAMQTAFETDVKAITLQSGSIPFLHSQISSWTALSGTLTAKSPYAVVEAWKAHPTKHNIVCPKYFLPYIDGVHLTKAGYAQLGEYYAKAYKKIVVDGGTWSPLYPTAIARVGAVITLTFGNTVGDLVLDNATVSDPGHYGFEFADDSGSTPTISSVALAGSSPVNQVVITLSGTPTGTKRARYAYTGVLNALAGPTTGPRGCLRDSDTSVTSLRGYDLWNWCLHFDEACP